MKSSELTPVTGNEKCIKTKTKARLNDTEVYNKVSKGNRIKANNSKSKLILT